ALPDPHNRSLVLQHTYVRCARNEGQFGDTPGLPMPMTLHPGLQSRTPSCQTQTPSSCHQISDRCGIQLTGCTSFTTP
uniref:Uncharacterized protein n=1 Tax=Aegilops tauschii subsp. strangulata TaxID=200361 RepID=A0A453SKV5_AEGTS